MKYILYDLINMLIYLQDKIHMDQEVDYMSVYNGKT